jgi:hypothetical protein
MAKMNDVSSNVEFYPYVVRGAHGSPLENSGPNNLDKQQSDAFIAFLKASRWGHAVENDFDLQGLCERIDGTKLLSAMVPIDRFIDMLTDAGDEFEAALLTANEWGSATECNEVIIHFVDNRITTQEIGFYE